MNLFERCRKSVTARERDDESSEDGCVESLPDDDSDAVDKKASGEKMRVPSMLPPPNSIYPESPSFVAITILLF